MMATSEDLIPLNAPSTGQSNGLIYFYKYQGCGNDFIMIDNTSGSFNMYTQNEALINQMCDRRFGIGADGLILIKEHPQLTFEMMNFNADGRISTLCANGNRCAIAFAHHRGILTQKECHFLVFDTEHKGFYDEEKDLIHVRMTDVDDVIEYKEEGCYFLDTGSPHYVTYIQGLKEYDVYNKGLEIRHSSRFKNYDEQGGTNANFVETVNGHEINVRTFERGVEAETLACGTAAVACAIIHMSLQQIHTADVEPMFAQVDVNFKGGKLSVMAKRVGPTSFREVTLIGPAKQVYSGTYQIKE